MGLTDMKISPSVCALNEVHMIVFIAIHVMSGMIGMLLISFVVRNNNSCEEIVYYNNYMANCQCMTFS